MRLPRSAAWRSGVSGEPSNCISARTRAVRGKMPNTACASKLLPAPLAPINATSSPRCTPTLTPFNTGNHSRRNKVR